MQMMPICIQKKFIIILSHGFVCVEPILSTKSTNSTRPFDQVKLKIPFIPNSSNVKKIKISRTKI